MAIENLAGMSSALSQIFLPLVRDQINRQCVALRYIRVVRGRGQNVSWNAKFTGTKAAEVFAEGSDVSTIGTTAKVPAILQYGNYRCPAGVSDKAVILAATADGSAEDLKMLFESEVKDSILELTKQINRDIYTGTGTSGGNPNIVGLTGGSCAETGIYAGINRATYAEWAGHEFGNSGTPRALTDDLLRTADAAIFDDGGGGANLILTTAGVHKKYGGLFASIQRVSTPGPAPTQLGAGTMDLFWNNMPVARDSDCPAGTLIMLSTDDVELVVPEAQLIQTGQYPPPQQTEVQGTDGMTIFTLPIVIELLPKAGNSINANATVYPQLRVKRPNRTAIITDINET